MKPQARHQHRSPVAVVTGIVYVLQVESGVDAPPDVHVVISLENVLAPVIESAITQQKAQSAQPQIILVVFLYGVGHHHHADLVALALPALSGKIASHLQGRSEEHTSEL